MDIRDVMRAFRRVSGPAGRLPNANTGALLDAGPLRIWTSKRVLKARTWLQRKLHRLPTWQGHGAWPIGSAYRASEHFIALRQRAAACDRAAELLAPLLKTDPRQLVGTASAFGAWFDATLPHLMIHLESRTQ